MDGLKDDHRVSGKHLRLNRNRKNLLIDSISIHLPTRRHSCRYCRSGITQILWAASFIPCRVRWRHTVGADAVFVDKHAIGWSADPDAGGFLASSRVSSRDQPALSRPVDRLDSADHVRRLGIGVRISLDRSRLLLGRHCDRIAHRVGDRALSRAEIGKRFLVVRICYRCVNQTQLWKRRS